MKHGLWSLPFRRAHSVAASAGGIAFVGGAGDFDANGAIRRPGDLEAQIAGAVENVAAALALEGCDLDDVVRVKAFYRSDGSVNEWSVLSALLRPFPADPSPAVTAHPVPLQSWSGQEVQVQAIAQRGWRRGGLVRVVTREVPRAHRHLLDRDRITVGLRAGELISVPGRTAADEVDDSIPTADGVEQTRIVMDRLQATLETLGASLQDAVKKEGYYFGTTVEEWARMAETRARYFREPGPVATVVPCHVLWPEGALTKVEVLAMREEWNGRDKYIPREDSWPKRVWDWPVALPYRQAIRLRGAIWLGGQVPWAPWENEGRVVHPGELIPQTRLTMTYIDDLLAGFGASTSDLALLVCYFTSKGSREATEAFLEAVADSVTGPLPPATVVPQPHMHSEDMTVEIWGVARSRPGPRL